MHHAGMQSPDQDVGALDCGHHATSGYLLMQLSKDCDSMPVSLVKLRQCGHWQAKCLQEEESQSPDVPYTGLAACMAAA